MQVVNSFKMLHVAVNDMPAAKEFYADKLGLEVVNDYRQDDSHWWVELALPEGGVHLTLSTYHAQMQPGTLTLYFATADIAAAHKSLGEDNVEVSEIQDDLHGPGSGTKWFNFKDPEGNVIHIEQV